jgi:hypothetical protein
MNNQNFPEHVLKLKAHGEKCIDWLLEILKQWPVAEYSRRIQFEIKTPREKKLIRKALLQFERWVGELAIQRAIHDQRKLNEMLDIVKFALLKEDFKDNAIDDVNRVRDEVLSLVTSMPISRRSDSESGGNRSPQIKKKTAFIIMAMGKLPELQDTCLTIKRVCKRHGFRAFRADDLQHGGIIIERIYESIATAELLIGDLTLERPNVYYEVGIAQGQAKEPILFRKQGTKLHFDLAGYDVPEYQNFFELETLLADRLKALSASRN